MNDRELDEPTTLGDCNKIYTIMGLKRPQLPLDESIFPNARALVKIHNERIQFISTIEGLKGEVERKTQTINSINNTLIDESKKIGHLRGEIERLNKLRIEQTEHQIDSGFYLNTKIQSLESKVETFRTALEDIKRIVNADEYYYRKFEQVEATVDEALGNAL